MDELHEKLVQRQKLMQLHDSGAIDTETFLRSMLASGMDLERMGIDLDELYDQYGFRGDWWKS